MLAEERFSSFSVHFRRVPAGRTISRALALRVKVRRDTARTANHLDFMTHLGLTLWNFWHVFPNYRVDPSPDCRGVNHKFILRSIELWDQTVSLWQQRSFSSVISGPPCQELLNFRQRLL